MADLFISGVREAEGGMSGGGERWGKGDPKTYEVRSGECIIMPEINDSSFLKCRIEGGLSRGEDYRQRRSAVIGRT